jgi:hypothetical protein
MIGPTPIIYVNSLNQTFPSQNLSKPVGTERGCSADVTVRALYQLM